MTQAIAFASLLRSQDHQLVGVVVGKSPRRTLPDFFKREIKAPIHSVESPNFECDNSSKKILIGKTIWKNSLRLNIFWGSLKKIDQLVEETQPDVILNFYDLLGGLYNFLFRPKTSFWVIGHQYLIQHPDFPFVAKKALDKALFQLNTYLTALGADERLALSFLPKENSTSSIRVVPPLLRQEVKKLIPKDGDFFLAYIVNPGYAEEVIHFAKQNPNLRIEVYWDKKDAAETEHSLPNLSFHKVHDRNFLQDMAACKGLVCTAGFESVCEAMYLGKPVMMIPVAGQYEQACNALDAVASGAGISSSNFDFAKFEEKIKHRGQTENELKKWTNSWSEIFQELIRVSKETQAKTLELQKSETWSFEP